MNTQQKGLIFGAVLGAVLGAVGGFLFTRGLELPRDESEGDLALRSLPPGAVVSLIISIMACAVLALALMIGSTIFWLTLSVLSATRRDFSWTRGR